MRKPRQVRTIRRTKAQMEVDRIDLLKQNIEPCEDEMFFEDNPIAVAETTPGSPTEEVGRVIRALPEVAFGMSGLSEIMDTSSNHYRFKHGSAFDGVRYTYEKKKETNN